MGVNVKRDGDVAIVELQGEFTLGRSGVSRPLDLHGHRLEDLGQTLRSLVDHGVHRLVLDLAGVRFLDSAGLGELVAWKKRTRQLGGDVKLLRPNQRVREVLELTTLSRVFQIFDGEAEAVTSFR